MSEQQIAFLNAFEAFAQRAFAKGGQHALHRTGTMMFEGVAVYYRKDPRQPEVVMIKLNGEEFDVVLWDA